MWRKLCPILILLATVNVKVIPGFPALGHLPTTSSGRYLSTTKPVQGNSLPGTVIDFGESSILTMDA